MKVLRILLSIVIVLVALVAVAIILALTPAVQTWAVRKAAASQPGLIVNVGRVSAGFHAADISDLRIVKNGVILSAARLSARYSAWDYLLHHRVTVADVTADNLVIDARNAGAATGSTIATRSSAPRQSAGATSRREPPDAASTSHQGFNGLLNEIKLPFDVQIARFSIPGRALLPDDQTATFEIHGSDITTGQQGTVDWKADLTSAANGAALRAVHTSGTANIHITSERRIDLVELNGVASAEGKNIPADQVKIDAKAEQPAAGGNEGYAAHVTLGQGSANKPLVTVAGQFNAGSHEITGVWNVAVRPEDVSGLLSGLGLPEFGADGSGKFAANPDANTASTTGELHATVSHPEKLSPDLAALGTLQANIAFDGALANQVASLEKLTVEAAAADGRKLVSIQTLQRVGFSLANKKVSFANAQSDLAHVTVDALPLAWAEPFLKPMTIQSGRLSTVLAIAADPDGSHVRLTAAQPLVVRDVTVRNGDQVLADRLTLSVKPQADYSADQLTAALNDLSVTTPTGDTVNGRFTADITELASTPKIAFTTDTQAKFVSLLKPYLKVETGPMTVATKSQGTLAGATLHFDASATRITREGGQLVAAIDLAQPVTFNLQTKAITTPKPDAEAMRISLGQIPLAWAQSYVPNSRIDGNVAGGAIAITLRSLDDVGASTTQPITVQGATVALNNQPMLQNVDVSADFTATRHGTTVSYNVRRIEAKQGAASLLTLVVAGDATLQAKPAITAKGTLKGDLGALAQQPIAASSDSLARGTLDATFDANIGDTIQAKANVTASNLVAKQGNRPLGTAVLDASATLQPDGSSVVNVPFTLTNGDRKSDVTLSGKLGRTGNTVNFDGSITSTLLVIDDLKPLAALAPSSSTTPAQPAAPSPAAASQPAAPAGGTRPAATPSAPPTLAAANGATVAATPPGPAAAQPFWSAAAGRIDVNLKQIIYGADYVISNVRGAATLSPTRLALNSLQGSAKDSPFQLNATIDFAADQPQPYTLSGAANVTNFDVGAILQAANPNEKPTLESKLTISAKFDGKGAGPMDIAKNVYGTFEVTGSKGVLRALGQKAGTTVNAVSTISGLAGALGLGGGQTSEWMTAISSLARKFAELPFDRFTMHVERGPDLNLKVTRLDFVSPDTRITGSGIIKNEPGVPVEKQPMDLTLSLGAKGDTEFLLSKIPHALSGKKDEQGYAVMSHTFTVGGSASKSDASSLWKTLGEAAAEKALPNLQQLPGLKNLLGH